MVNDMPKLDLTPWRPGAVFFSLFFLEQVGRDQLVTDIQQQPMTVNQFERMTIESQQVLRAASQVAYVAIVQAQRASKR